MNFSQYPHLQFRRKFWKLFGAEIRIVTPAEEHLATIHQKAFKLKEDIRLSSALVPGTDLLQIRARQVIDFGATYDVFLGASTTPAFSLQRKGLQSNFVRDYWKILNANGIQVGSVRETSSSLAVMRRWLGFIPLVGPIVDLVFAFIPQTYGIYMGEDNLDTPADATITHRKNPILVRMDLDISAAPSGYDYNLGVAATALLSVIDAVKN